MRFALLPLALSVVSCLTPVVVTANLGFSEDRYEDDEVVDEEDDRTGLFEL